MGESVFWPNTLAEKGGKSQQKKLQQILLCKSDEFCNKVAYLKTISDISLQIICDDP